MHFAEISPLPRQHDLLSQDTGFADGGRTAVMSKPSQGIWLSGLAEQRLQVLPAQAIHHGQTSVTVSCDIQFLKACL